MKKYRIQKLKPTKECLQSLPNLSPDNTSRYEGEDPAPNGVLCLGAVWYRLLNELPEGATTLGNLRCGDSGNKPDGVLCQGRDRYPYYSKQEGRQIGYLALPTAGEYLLVTTKPLLLLWLPVFIAVVLLCTLLISGICMVGVPVVIYSSDAVSDGAITDSKQEPLEADYFNIKVNATPILADGQMNLRIENSERNIYSCHVEVVVETNTGEQSIYTSPVLEPNQHLEYATVQAELPAGTYDGTATFHYYSGDVSFNTTSSVRLLISVR